MVLVGNPATGPGYSAVEATGGNQILRHDAGGDRWQTQDGWLTGKAAVFLDINMPDRMTRLSVYALPSGAPARWRGDGQVEGVSPEANVGGEWLAYFSGTPDTRMCLTGVDLRSLMSTHPLCGQRGETWGDPSNVDARVVFSRLLHPADPTKRCKSLMVLDMRSGQRDSAIVRAIAHHASCLAWDGVPVRGGGVAWDEGDPSDPTFGTSNGFYADDSGAVVNLGRMDTDSIVPCGPYVFWLRSTRASARVFEWAPGQHRPMVVLEPGKNRLPTTPQCTEDRFLSTRVDDIGGHDEKLTLMTLDTSK